MSDASLSPTDVEATAGNEHSDADPTPERRSRLGSIPALAAAVALGALGESVTVAAAGLVVLAWVGASALAAFAVGQIALAAVAGTAPWIFLLAVQGALATLLFEPALTARRSVRHALVTVLALGGLGAIAGGVWVASDQIWVAAGAVAVATAVAAYVLHRWSLLATGVLSDE